MTIELTTKEKRGALAYMRKMVSNPEATDAQKEKLRGGIDFLERDLGADDRKTDPSTRPGFAGPAREFSGDGDLHPVKKAAAKFGGWAPSYRPLESSTMQVSAEDELAHQQAYIKSLDKLSGLPDGDPWQDFSMLRVMLAQNMSRQQGLGLDTALKRYAPREHKWIEAVSKAQGEMATGVDGGFLASEAWNARFQELIYAATVTSQLPLTRLPMVGRVEHVPKMTGQMTVYYAAENAALTQSQAQLAQVSFTARKASALVYLSNEMIRDATPDAEMVFRNHIVQILAIDRDYQVLLGNGQTGTPVGLYNQTNVTKIPMAGANLAYTDLVNLIYQVENLNGSTNVPVGQTTCTGIVSAVNLTKQVQSMVDSSGRPLADYGFALGAFRRPAEAINTSAFLQQLFGVDTWLRTNILRLSLNASAQSVPTGTGTVNPIFAGDWKHLWLKERQDVEFLSSLVAGQAFVNDQTAIRAIARYDTACMHPEAFTVLNNVPAA